VAAPGERRVAAPGERRVAAPGERRVAAPGERRVAAPGERRVAAPTPARRGWAVRRGRAAIWPALAVPAGAAGSTLTTAVAAAVAGRQSDLALQPVELTLRVVLLLAAPCVGAMVAAVVIPRPSQEAIYRLAVVGIGLGVPFGPVLVLRLDRVVEFGVGTTVLTLGVLVAWGLVGSALAAGWWVRPSRWVERTELPGPELPGPEPPR